MDERFELKTIVITPNGDEAGLIIEYDQDVLTFKIKEQVLFEGDWDANFKDVFIRFIELFGKE